MNPLVHFVYQTRNALTILLGLFSPFLFSSLLLLSLSLCVCVCARVFRWVLCGFAVLLVLLNLLDEGLELALQGENENDGSQFLVSPFGFWWCLKPEVSLEEMMTEEAAAQQSLTTRQVHSSGRLSELSPLLGESVANMRLSTFDLNNMA